MLQPRGGIFRLGIYNWIYCCDSPIIVMRNSVLISSARFYVLWLSTIPLRYSGFFFGFIDGILSLPTCSFSNPLACFALRGTHFRRTRNYLRGVSVMHFLFNKRGASRLDKNKNACFKYGNPYTLVMLRVVQL